MFFKKAISFYNSNPGKCIVIDRNGFVIYRKEFMDGTEKKLENQHIVKLVSLYALNNLMC